ncbi:non-homologous end joining protein Ku [Streptomyces sulfonofaciens]|nr:Ku protein [Streptomyces sulfonofaciens]
MRSIWNGAISFGLVSIPIKLVNATESHSVSFRQIHIADGGRVRYRRVCELEDREVPQDEMSRGYRSPDGSIVPITEDDLASLPVPTAKTIGIVAFVPADRIDPLQLSTAYYLEANGSSAVKPYTLLREALKRSGRVAVAKYALRGRERLGMLRVFGDVIAMHGLLWPDEIRAPELAAPETEVTVRDAELDLADTLMDTLGEVDLDSLHDDYRTALEELIAAKTTGRPLERPEAEPGGKVIDLMAALESSVRAARSRGEEPAAGRTTAGAARERPARGQARAKTARKKSAEKRTSAKRTAEKKPAEKKTAEKRAAGKKAAEGRAAGKKATAGSGKKATTERATAKKSAPRGRKSA